jgi:HPt (histidine-containing phosphotransfer) domain-containing protein
MTSEPLPPGAAAASAGQPVGLDDAALARLRELDPDGRHGVLRRVLQAFETSLVRMLAQLAAERSDGDAGVVAGVAHTLKSSSASVGALQLAAACADVERRLRTGTPGNLGADVEHLLTEGEAALLAVAAMLRS